MSCKNLLLPKLWLVTETANVGYKIREAELSACGLNECCVRRVLTAEEQRQRDVALHPFNQGVCGLQFCGESLYVSPEFTMFRLQDFASEIN